jgi:hypothetical protein
MLRHGAQGMVHGAGHGGERRDNLRTERRVAAMIHTAISAAISPYSIAVTSRFILK